jgi:hypothetical protein
LQALLFPVLARQLLVLLVLVLLLWQKSSKLTHA